MKIILLMAIMISNGALAQENDTEQRMYRKTAEALVKYYGVDVTVETALKRYKYQVLPKEYHRYIPYFGTLGTLLINQKLVFRKSF
jgi:hypothetical protein